MALLKWYLCPPNRGILPTQLCVMPTLSQSVIAQYNTQYNTQYNAQRKINSNTPLLGMSMSKTAIAAAVGSLLCSGEIKSLNDEAGTYSKFLASTPYGAVSIRDILQMNSGVSPLGRTDEKRFNRKSRGVQKFDGKANVREALNFYKSAARDAEGRCRQ